MSLKLMEIFTKLQKLNSTFIVCASFNPSELGPLGGVFVFYYGYDFSYFFKDKWGGEAPAVTLPLRYSRL